MAALWRIVRDLLAVLPGGSSRFIVTFAVLSAALSILDVAALGLLAITMAPMISGAELTIPVLGWTLSEPTDFRNMLVIVGALIVAKSVFAVTLQYFATRRFARFEQDLGSQLLNAFFESPWTDRLGRNSTDLVRSTDVGVATTVSGVLIPAAMLSGEIFTFVAVLVVLIVAQPVIALVAIAYFGVIGAFLYLWVLRKAVEAGRVNRNYSTRSVRLVSEMVHSLKEITLRGKGPEVAGVVRQVRLKSSHARANMSFLGVVPRYVLEAGLIGGLAIGAGVGYLQDGVTGALGAVALFGVAGFRIVPSLTRFQSIMAQTGASMPFAQQVLDEIRKGDQRREARPAEGTTAPIPAEADRLTLEDVSFTYPSGSTEAVREVSMTLPFGHSLALVGASGSGKSTLVDLMLGLLEPSAGRILVGTTPMGTVLDDWRSRVGYVPQEVSLFDSTVAQNVALTWIPEQVDEDRVRRALARAQILDVVEAREDGIHARIGERGLSLSGGQRQRIGIARALYNDPLVLIMDEATSALDTSTEAAVTSAIRELRGDVTMVVVAHRLATIRHSDVVCFMRDGELVAHGTFDEVVAAEADFAEQAALAGLTGEIEPQ
ncbi:ABC transporter ATP-binding protein [Occultella glacieicola]|uniref:ABC transporter ATP-binding protein n=1 Tax=Occultella glacieicola TaxID=2518684 RepID=A0ABY2E6E1_9MICO|nr:ABC transporter ATP-binding protein [Occultella glacieicola]TDE96156.1 ABC transporter ATP-binding protein [Occultella glacieicola]